MLAKMLENLTPNLRLWFFSLASSDLGKSEEAARSAVELGDLGQFDTEHARALIEIAVIRYARPFKACRLPGKAGQTRLPQDIVPQEGNTPQFHKMLLGIRDQSAAHSDLTVREVRIELARVNGAERVWLGHTSSDSLRRPQVERLAELALAMRRIILPELNALALAAFPNAIVGEVHEILP